MQRITNSMLTSRYLSNMTKNLNSMSLVQNQLSTGNEITRTSQDPYKATRIKQLTNQIAENKQYNANIKDTSNWLDTTDTALSEAGNVLARIRELMVKAGNGAYSKDEINTIKNEAIEKSKELAQILNTSFDGDYIFGGTKSTTKPVTVDEYGNISYADDNGNALPCNSDGSKITSGTKTITGLAQDGTTISIETTDSGTTPPTVGNKSVSTIKSAGPPIVYYSESELKTQLNSAEGFGGDAMYYSLGEAKKIASGLKTEISQGVKVEYNKTAVDIFQFKDSEDSNINAMAEISNLIQNFTIASGTNSDGTEATEEEMKNALSELNGDNLGKLDLMIENLLACRSQVGAMQNRMESAQSTNEDQTFNMTEILSGIGDIDFTEKTMEYAVMQTVYTASLQTSSKVLMNTILDYI